ncbi:MAG: DUF4388 domain-containing protein [Desulfonatronovibrionaceae bacterium]
MLSGNLSSFSLISLLQICNNENKDGAIIFASPDEGEECGSIYFTGGTPEYARFFDRQGIEAVKQLHLASRHDFHFDPGRKNPGENIDKDLNFILLECSRHKDEIESYMQKLKPVMQKRFGADAVTLFTYENKCIRLFAELGQIVDFKEIEFYEFLNDNRHVFIFFDQNITAHIQVEAGTQLYTDEIVNFLREKGMLS